MVLGALLLSLGPVIFLFLFSYGLLNRSIEKWFSRPAEDVEYRTNVIASLLTEYAHDQRARRGAADRRHPRRAEVVSHRAISPSSWTSSAAAKITLQGGFAFALVDDRAEASFHAPEAWPLMRRHLPPGAPVQAPGDAV